MRRSSMLVGLITGTLVCAANMVLSQQTSAQEIDFGKIDKFESLATGTPALARR